MLALRNPTLAALLIAGSFLGSAATAQGQQPPATQVVRNTNTKTSFLDIPSDQVPAKGMCRNWIDNVPADRQPAVTDCATALRNKTANERTVFGDDYMQPVSKTTRPALPEPFQNEHPGTVPMRQSTTVPASTFPAVKPATAPAKPPTTRPHG